MGPELSLVPDFGSGAQCVTFTHTGSPRISRRASGRWTARWCDEVWHAAPLGPAWSTHQASPNGLQRRAGATSDLVRPLAARRICCSEPVPGHISRPGRPRHVWFPGLISSSAVAPRAHKWDKMDERGCRGPARIFSGPFPWFLALERLISRFRRRSSHFISILINGSCHSRVTLPCYIFRTGRTTLSAS